MDKEKIYSPVTAIVIYETSAVKCKHRSPLLLALDLEIRTLYFMCALLEKKRTWQRYLFFSERAPELLFRAHSNAMVG